MTTKLRVVLAIVLLAIVSVAAGCGGSHHAKKQPVIQKTTPQVCNASRTVCIPKTYTSPPLLPRAPQGGVKYGFDHAWGLLSPSQLRNAGGSFDIGYVSFDYSKNLSLGEIKSMSAAGDQIQLVWESAANRALAGYYAGRADAQEALRQARNVGLPSNKPIYFAVDFDTTGIAGQIFPYFRGADSVLGVNRVGDYGGLATVTGLSQAHLVHYNWQTLAWSPRWSGYACLEQYAINWFVAGVGVDPNRAYCDYGGWRYGEKPVKPLPPIAKAWYRTCVQLDNITYFKYHQGHGHVSRTQHFQAVDDRNHLKKYKTGCTRPGWMLRPRTNAVSKPYRYPQRKGALA